MLPSSPMAQPVGNWTHWRANFYGPMVWIIRMAPAMALALIWAFMKAPQRIAAFGGMNEPLREGMICSNEPGYYKEGEYGIRIENLVLLEKRDIAGAEQDMLGFETLTFAPIDRNLVALDLMTDGELQWLNDYHAKTFEIVAPQLSGEPLEWLKQACAPLTR